MDFGEKKGHSENSHDWHGEHALGDFLTDLAWEVFGVVERREEGVVDMGVVDVVLAGTADTIGTAVGVDVG